MASPVIQFKRGLLANLPGLQAGEPGFTTDSYDLYVGLTSETATNKIIGSHRFWTNNTSTTGSGVNLVEGTNNGTQFITLKSPDSLSGIVTYTMPGTDGTNGQALVTNGSGTLSFATVTTSAATLTGAGAGVTTFLVSPSSANLASAVTDETGSGSLVFANSPTLINPTLGNASATNINVSGIVTTSQLRIGTGIAATQFSGSVSTGTSTSSIPTSSAVINYVNSYVSTEVGNIDLTLGINADTGGPGTVTTSQTLTIAGTAGEVETSLAGQTITVGLPNTVIVGTALSAPTLQTATLQHRNGTQAATIDTSGNITASQNLTVSGNLYVNGSTTQVNTSSLSVEDRTIELGLVDGSAPGSATTWDLGVLFNYNSSGAKKSGVVWEQNDGRFKFGSQVSDGGGTDVNSPQITFTTYAPIEIASLWVNDCAGQSQVITCSGTTRRLENITIDGGSF